MPPQTRTRAKVLKENIGVENDTKTCRKSTKPTRRALADKTNSLSDDNDSTEVPKKVRKPTKKVKNAIVNNIRSRRDRRLPTRFIENSLLKNLSNNKDSSINEIVPAHVSKIDIINNHKNTTEINNGESSNKNKPLIQENKTSNGNIPSPFKTPSKNLENTLVINRPKRLHRLPSRFEDHSISPNKFIPVQPCHASTPLLKKTQKITTNVPKSKPILSKVSKTRAGSNKLTLNKKNDESLIKSSPDSNNNPKKIRPVRQKAKNLNNKSKSPIIGPKSKTNGVLGKRLLKNSTSFKVLENKQMKDVGDKSLDVYEFTFDPEEEPPPQKKKRKRVNRKKSPRPKTVTYKTNYNENVSKALNALKNMISKKPLQKSKIQVQPRLVQNEDNVTNKVTAKAPQSQIVGGNNHLPKKPVVLVKPPHMSANKAQGASKYQAQVETNIIPNISTNVPARDPTKNSIHVPNHPSIRIEDIAADFELSDPHHDDINYSPINSPSHPVSPNPQHYTNECLVTAVNNKDPLNLQGESFFDDQPVASSSMNASIRHPLASPWRVEFGSLPIKWQVNTYVKPNMTPAVESSFISSESNNNKKHVYTNMIADGNNSLPHIETNTSNLKQTSIISFIKEVAERHASRKKRGIPVTPTKANSLFEDITNTTHVNRNPLRVENKGVNNEDPDKNKSNGSDEFIEKENPRVNGKRKNVNKISEVPAKSPRKQRNKDCTYFGFDDSENQDQENMLSSKHNLRVKALKPRSQAILQEVNRQMGPTRIPLPVAAKSKKATSSEASNKVYEEIKSAEAAPTFLDKNAVCNPETTNIDFSLNNEDSESVHLFEDIQFVHHLKATRKSYVKVKKVTFQKKSDSDSDIQPSEVAEQSETSDVDDLGDLTFTMPTIKEKRIVKKKKTKKKMSKKEEQEVEAWAAGFNSMCEDVEEFPLVVE